MTQKLRLLNYIVGAVLVVEDEDGNFVGKQNMEPTEVFSEAEVVQLFDRINTAIREHNGKPEIVVPDGKTL